MTTLYRLPRVNFNQNLRLASAIGNNNNSQAINCWGSIIAVRHYQKPTSNQGLSSTRFEQPKQITEILEREIQDESAELNQHLSTDQFPGFSVETIDSDVKLSKQIGKTTVTVKFTVSSSLNEWPAEGAGQAPPQSAEEQDMSTTLMSMPEFQVEITKNNRTLALNCLFEEMDHDEETGEPFSSDPMFAIDELVLYEGEPKETEFAVNAEYFQDDLQAALLQYLAEHGIDDEFAKNLVSFATSYEKKQYIGLMQRLKNFVSE